MARRRHRRVPMFTLNGNLTIPDDKPNIDLLLRITSTPVIEQCAVSTKQIHISGFVKVFTEYVASVTDETQPISFVFFKLPFDEVYANYHARVGRAACINCAVTNQRLQIISPREISVSQNLKILGTKFVPGSNTIPLHRSKSCLVNFFETSNFSGANPETDIQPCSNPTNSSENT